jgi:Na+(H+)/acetate symporter ActP
LIILSHPLRMILVYFVVISIILSLLEPEYAVLFMHAFSAISSCCISLLHLQADR